MMWNLNLSKFPQHLASASFLLLFPGYFFYHYSVARDLIPPVLGGYFGLMSVFLLLPLALTNFSLALRSLNFSISLFLTIVISSIFVGGFQYASMQPRTLSYEMLIWALTGLVFNVTFFFIGMRLQFETIARIGLWLIPSMTSIIVLNSQDRGYFYLSVESGELSEVISGYQGFARSLVALLLITFVYYRDQVLKLAPIFIFGASGLFFCGARTEFTLFVLAVIISQGFKIIKSPKNFMHFALWSFVAIGTSIYFVNAFPDSRFSALFDFSGGTSSSARIAQFLYAVDQISKNIFFGNYGSYTELGSVGSYPHNIISAWINLGLIGFCLYILLFAALWTEASTMLKQRNDVHFEVFFFFLIFVTLALLVSKPYSYELVGLLIGFYCQSCQRAKDNKKIFIHTKSDNLT